MKKILICFLFLSLYGSTYSNNEIKDLNFLVDGKIVYGQYIYKRIDAIIDDKAENLEEKKDFYESIIKNLEKKENNNKSKKIKAIINYGYNEVIKDIQNPYSKTKKIILGYTSEGKEIYAYYKGKPENGYFGVFANIHGGYEYGTYNTALYIKNALETSGKTGRFIIPTINPDGLEYFFENKYEKSHYIEGRANSNNVDINRNFCTSNFELKEYVKLGETLKTGIDKCESEVETKIIVNTLKKYKFNKVISLHSRGSIIFLPDNSIEDDGVIDFGKDIGNILEGYSFDVNYHSQNEKDQKIFEYEIDEGGSMNYTGTMESYIYEKYKIPTLLIELEEHGKIEFKFKKIVDLID